MVVNKMNKDSNDLFRSFSHNYQTGLIKSVKGCVFAFDYVKELYENVTK